MATRYQLNEYNPDTGVERVYGVWDNESDAQFEKTVCNAEGDNIYTIEEIQVADDARRTYTLEDGRMLEVVLTDEGMVVDLYNADGTEVLASYYRWTDELVPEGVN